MDPRGAAAANERAIFPRARRSRRVPLRNLSSELVNRMAVLQWARANGCPWNEDTCSAAAKNGHLELLQWARANGCPSA